ncbi:PD-(D/E)XK nuclease family protein [Streptomyces sp. NPDC021224]|uniref:PD-(D/E)XK nuclease family protein n=1 Tax=unclassified Streptomyces TaxID=2593676 RepID=UPI003788420F
MRVRPRPLAVLREDRPAPTSRALGPLHDVLDLIEFGRLGTEEALIKWEAAPKRPVHPALVQWTEHAVRGYLAATAALPAAPGIPPDVPLEPFSRVWARQRGPLRPGDPDRYEEIVLDRRYAGHGVRELRLVRAGSVEKNPPDDMEIAVAAGVLAGGRPVLSSRWAATPLVLGGYEPPRFVRLVEIGCADGSHRVLFEGPPAEAYARYTPEVEAHVGRIVAGGSYRPGKNCGRCAAVADCPAVVSAPGLLAVAAPGAPRRSWSVTTGRSYRRCPARSHLEGLFLPRETAAEDTEAVIRGRAVHAWIESRHRRSPQQPCTPDDVPGPPEAWRYQEWSLSGLQARLGIQMIADHALVCPLQNRPADTEVHPERTVVAYDPTAGVVVLAKSDLLYRVADRWTLRETKTARVPDEGNLLAQHPQLALAVLLSHAGVLPGRHCGVELERLTGTGPIVTRFDVAAPDVAAEARTVMAEYIAPWRADSQFTTAPGAACTDCPFTRWCPDAAAGGSR